MSINFEYYKTFYYVAKYQKISEAANKLFVSQPAVTQTIQKLEEQLGVNLFFRLKQGIELTEPGKILYNFIWDSIETLDNAEYKLNKYENLEEGMIKIKTGSTIAKSVLCSALSKYSKDYPNIKIEISSDAPHKSIEMLHMGEVDLVLLHLPFDIKYNNLKIESSFEKEYVFAMSKKYFEDNEVKIKKIEDLANYSLILPKKESSVKKIFNEKYGNLFKEPHFEISQEILKKELIMENLGIAFIAKDEIKDELKSGKIIQVNLDDAIIKVNVGAVTLNDNIMTFATKKLVEYLKEECLKD